MPAVLLSFSTGSVGKAWRRHGGGLGPGDVSLACRDQASLARGRSGDERTGARQEVSETEFVLFTVRARNAFVSLLSLVGFWYPIGQRRHMKMVQCMVCVWGRGRGAGGISNIPNLIWQFSGAFLLCFYFCCVETYSGYRRAYGGCGSLNDWKPGRTV